MSIDSEIIGSGRIPTILFPVRCAGFGNTEAQRTRRGSPLLLYLKSLFDPFSVSLCLCVSKKEFRTAHPSSTGIWKHRGTEFTEKKPAPALYKIPFRPLLCASVSLCFKKRATDRASFQRDIWKHRGTENTETGTRTLIRD